MVQKIGLLAARQVDTLATALAYGARMLSMDLLNKSDGPVPLSSIPLKGFPANELMLSVSF